MEAASRSRRIRLEELKRRKQASLSDVGSKNSIVIELPTAISFDDDEEEDEASIKTWSTTKLVRSFRVKDTKSKVDYKQLKDTIEKGECGWLIGELQQYHRAG
jgi:hypothetical protein